MLTTTHFTRRRDAITRLLKIHLRNYPEHVVAQAIREAGKVLSADPTSACRAIRAGELYAWTRMEARPIAGQRPHDNGSRHEQPDA